MITYFVECHLFDIMHRTDTHKLVQKSKLESKSAYIKNSQLYMAAWSSLLKKSLRGAGSYVELNDCTFLDLGSGKGKAVVYARLHKVCGKSPDRYHGIDFDQNLISISERNSEKVFGDVGNFHHLDVLEFDYSIFQNRLVFFLYNPFDEVVLDLLAKRAFYRKQDSLIIYNHPVHREVVIRHGGVSKLRVEAWHPNLTFEIFFLPGRHKV